MRLAILLSLLPAVALAGELSSPLVFSTNAVRIDCVITNVGDRAVEIVSGITRNFQGADVTDDDCPQSLAPRTSCAFGGNALNGWGRAEVKGSVKDVRGQCQLNDANDRVLATVEMR